MFPYPDYGAGYADLYSVFKFKELPARRGKMLMTFKKIKK